MSHWMTVRSAIVAFSIGTMSCTGSWPRRKPPGWIDRWRGNSRISSDQTHEMLECGGVSAIETRMREGLPLDVAV